ncbi:uncharacterized protein NMK_1888 [Novimethylophilus kurashikiensis]|uniref:Uncharacterized protein n=1 Tax=Novimethylophilus kurashikiensis TaxID=1825523 RepID=A0A2R5F7T4_9PROT|nr:prephenate dehydrogenase/arogenate dehydrogenase family protein [Novimethylophilus kurashikiensis]GBG14300.1 uncharacterized protein NMK_1888 [Novimethylophilus kurashikiensis]
MAVAINIVGAGVFGTFLRTVLAPFCLFSEDADIAILAVPFDAYEDVASAHAGKHLVNVCSVQDATNSICLRHSDRVTGIHPMFGPRSPAAGRTSIVTLTNSCSDEVLEVFGSISSLVEFANGERITGETHDRMMAKTHLQVVRLADKINAIVADASDIPDECLPTSFKRLKAMAEQFLDMPPGTKSSILANSHWSSSAKLGGNVVKLKV